MPNRYSIKPSFVIPSLTKRLSLRSTHFTISGFTMIELMVTIAIAGILTAVAIPSFNNFITSTRVDSEISELYRLLLTARNTAINTGQNVTVCPLNTSNTCSANWQGQISVFTNTANNTTYDAVNETLVKVKDGVQTGDLLQYSQSSIIYTPAGRLTNNTSDTFSYCPKNNADMSRGIDVTISGRVYSTSDNDKDGKDETRNGSEIICS
jgi:type IV fimbrial biogenesis protein FimT